MTNQMIRRFQLKGRTTNLKLEQTKTTLRIRLMQMMRDEGFIPLLDIDPVWNWEWVADELYDFTYTWHGIFVGEDEAWQLDGNSGGKMIPSSPKIR